MRLWSRQRQFHLWLRPLLVPEGVDVQPHGFVC
jgi:hypothetical protein